jgi:predicted Zn-ribbon and HTH transcriptional regulator
MANDKVIPVKRVCETCGTEYETNGVVPVSVCPACNQALLDTFWQGYDEVR